jgi:LacI family repressor for deo operon, udp, cdd, tsx, nupC, and nupG
VNGAPRGHASIEDVARRAGVSAATVSRSLRGLSNVSPQTRARVARAAAELSYVASPAASRLASGRTQAIGVVVPFVTRWFFSQVVSGAEAVLHEAGLDLLLYNVGDDEGRQRFFSRMPLHRRVDAVLVISVPLSAAELAALHALARPVVLVGRPAPGCGSVGIDDAGGAATAVRHLLNLRHEHVAMVSGDGEDPLGFPTSRDRRRGFAEALTAAGGALRAEHTVSAPWGLGGGAEAMAQLLAADRLPSAVFFESDEMAFGGMRTVRQAGLDVPGDISIVGFDDHEMAGVVDLTTIAQPVRRQGEIAARMLLDALAGHDDVPADVRLPTRLVVRGSSGPVPRALPGVDPGLTTMPGRGAP